MYTGVLNGEPTARYFDIFSHSHPPFPYTCTSTAFMRYSLNVLDNALHNWLFPHHCSKGGAMVLPTLMLKYIVLQH